MADDDEEGTPLAGANLFRLIQNGVYCGILIDCQSEEAAKQAYDAILKACHEEGGVTITVKGIPEEGGPTIVLKGGDHGGG